MSWSFSNELSVPLLSPAVRRTPVWVLPIPSFVGPYNAWCSHTAHSALTPEVLYRSTGCPSSFHPIRRMLACLAPTLSKLGRFNAPSFQICLPRGPPRLTAGRVERRMRTVGEPRVAQGLSLPKHMLRPSASVIAAAPADLTGDSARHRQFYAATLADRFTHAYVLVWWQSSIGRAATCSTKEASFGKNKHHPSSLSPNLSSAL